MSTNTIVIPIGPLKHLRVLARVPWVPFGAVGLCMALGAVMGFLLGGSLYYGTVGKAAGGIAGGLMAAAWAIFILQEGQRQDAEVHQAARRASLEAPSA